MLFQGSQAGGMQVKSGRGMSWWTPGEWPGQVSFGISLKMSLEKSGAKKVCFEDLNKDMFLEIQNETCS